MIIGKSKCDSSGDIIFDSLIYKVSTHVVTNSKKAPLQYHLLTSINDSVNRSKRTLIYVAIITTFNEYGNR